MSTLTGEADIRVALLSQSMMGMLPAAILTTKVLRLCEPDYVVMTGVCAGVEGRTNKGDILIADSVFDYGSGKIIEGELHPDYSPVPVASSVVDVLRDCVT